MVFPVPDDDRSTKHFFIIPVVLIVFCFLAFAGGTVAFVSWSVSSSEHKWCSVIDLLDAAPAPPNANTSNPSRQYDAQLASDFSVLKKRLGC